MAEINRTYNIPLRSGFVKKPKHVRSKVAIRIIKEFLTKHMKPTTLKLGKHLNLEVWKDGIKNPPHHIKVDVTKNDEGLVHAELFGFKYEDKKKVEKKESFKDRLMNKVAGPQQTVVKKVKDEKPAPVKVEAKPVVKEEVKAETPVETKPSEETK
jgi:large subunit ribosomal protein L31e